MSRAAEAGDHHGAAEPGQVNSHTGGVTPVYRLHLDINIPFKHLFILDKYLKMILINQYKYFAVYKFRACLIF